MSYVFICLDCGAEYQDQPRSECDECRSKRFDVVYSVGDLPRC